MTPEQFAPSLRALRRIVAERLGAVEITTAAQETRTGHDGLAPFGLDEVGAPDQQADALVGAILEPLGPRQRGELAQAAETVSRLLEASAVVIEAADPAAAEASEAIGAYYRTLDTRFDTGFAPDRSLPAEADALRPPAGVLLVATLHGKAVGCVAVMTEEPGVGHLRRMWVSPEMRGVGLGRRLLAAAESAAVDLGARIVRLETHRSLTEAIGLYRSAGYREVAPFNDEPYAHHWFEKALGEEPPRPVGFVGLGIMGLPMARRLAGAGVPLVVWNRTPREDAALAAAGAQWAESVDAVFARCDTVVMMLRDEDAVDAVLRGSPDGIAALVAGRTVVQMGTVSPAYSQVLAREVEQAGGRYVEAPVSGSRVPAQEGGLVAMVAGPPEAVRDVQPILEPMCASITPCGEVPSALTMKLAVNVFLIALVTGLAEAFHFARRHGLDPDVLRGVLDAGQMASPISRVKTAKLVADDFAPQAAITDVHKNAALIVDAAATAGATVPLSRVCEALYREAVERGDGAIDMIGVVRAFGARRQTSEGEAP